MLPLPLLLATSRYFYLNYDSLLVSVDEFVSVCAHLAWSTSSAKTAKTTEGGLVRSGPLVLGAPSRPLVVVVVVVVVEEEKMAVM